jgi:hypothetical protein
MGSVSGRRACSPPAGSVFAADTTCIVRTGDGHRQPAPRHRVENRLVELRDKTMPVLFRLVENRLVELRDRTMPVLFRLFFHSPDGRRPPPASTAAPRRKPPCGVAGQDYACPFPAPLELRDRTMPVLFRLLFPSPERTGLCLSFSGSFRTMPVLFRLPAWQHAGCAAFRSGVWRRPRRRCRRRWSR